MAIVSTDGPPSGIHAKNFDTILARWTEIWPEMRQVFSELMESYHHERPDWKRVNCVYISLTSQPIVEDAEWSVGVVFSGSDTLWSLPYHGWTACPQQAQASY